MRGAAIVAALLAALQVSAWANVMEDNLGRAHTLHASHRASHRTHIRGDVHTPTPAF